jgi:hypothetical protein
MMRLIVRCLPLELVPAQYVACGVVMASLIMERSLGESVPKFCSRGPRTLGDTVFRVPSGGFSSMGIPIGEILGNLSGIQGCEASVDGCKAWSGTCDEASEVSPWNGCSIEAASENDSENCSVEPRGAFLSKFWGCARSPSLICRTGLLPCPRLKPLSLCHVEATPASPIPYFTVSKKLSKRT